MATKRKMKVSINYTAGQVVTFEGEQAKQVLQQYKQHELGQSATEGLTYTDDQGETHGVEWRCLCGYTIHPTETEEVPDRECDPRDCIEPIVRPENPLDIKVTATADGAIITATPIEGVQLVLYKGITEEVAVGEAGKGEVILTGLAAGTVVDAGEYKLANRGPVRESQKVFAPAFTVPGAPTPPPTPAPAKK